MKDRIVIVCPRCYGIDHRPLNTRHMAVYRCPNRNCGATALVEVHATGGFSLGCWSTPPTNDQICEADPRPAGHWLVRLVSSLKRLFKEAP